MWTQKVPLNRLNLRVAAFFRVVAASLKPQFRSRLFNFVPGAVSLRPLNGKLPPRGPNSCKGAPFRALDFRRASSPVVTSEASG